MIYLISDTHGKDIEIPDDCTTLIHLGDYEGGGLSRDVFSVLVIGNHDIGTNAAFDLVCDGIRMEHCYLSHEPMERIPRGTHLNIHGHMNGEPYSDYGYEKKNFHVELEPNKLYKLEEF